MLADKATTKTLPEYLIPKFFSENGQIVQYVCPLATSDQLWAYDRNYKFWAPYLMGYPQNFDFTDVYLIQHQRTNNPYNPVPEDCHYITTESILTTTICTMPPECGTPYKFAISKSSWYPWGVVLCYGTGISPDYDDQSLTLVGSGMVEWYSWHADTYDTIWANISARTMIMYDGINYYHTPPEMHDYLFFYYEGKIYRSSLWWNPTNSCYNAWNPNVVNTHFDRILIGPKLFEYKILPDGTVVNRSLLLAANPMPWILNSNEHPHPLTINPFHIKRTFKMETICLGGADFTCLPTHCVMEEPDCSIPLKFRTLSYASLIYEAMMAFVSHLLKAITQLIQQTVKVLLSKLILFATKTHFIAWFPIYYKTRDITITVVCTILFVSASYCFTK